MKVYLSSMSWRRMAFLVREGVSFLKGAVDEFLTDNCLHLSASIAYYVLFSLFPLTLAFISVLGFIMKSPELEMKVVEGIDNFLPVSGELVGSSIRGVVGSRGAIGAIATIGLLWAGSSVFNAIRKALNAAWGIRQPRPFLVERLTELGMMLGMGLLLLLSLGLTGTLGVVRRLSLPFLGMEFLNGDVLWQILLAIVTTGLAFVTFLILYRFIPNTTVRWRDVWMGALMAAIGFEVAKQVFVWYATGFAHYNLIYGPVGTIIALLVWTYVSAVILLFCAKITSLYSRSRKRPGRAKIIGGVRANRGWPRAAVDLPRLASDDDCARSDAPGRDAPARGHAEPMIRERRHG